MARAYSIERRIAAICPTTLLRGVERTRGGLDELSEAPKDAFFRTTNQVFASGLAVDRPARLPELPRATRKGTMLRKGEREVGVQTERYPTGRFFKK